jgi:hypothetical protein
MHTLASAADSAAALLAVVTAAITSYTMARGAGPTDADEAAAAARCAALAALSLDGSEPSARLAALAACLPSADMGAGAGRGPLSPGQRLALLPDRAPAALANAARLALRCAYSAALDSLRDARTHGLTGRRSGIVRTGSVSLSDEVGQRAAAAAALGQWRGADPSPLTPHPSPLRRALALARSLRQSEAAHRARLQAAHAQRWPGLASSSPAALRAWGRTRSAAASQWRNTRRVLVQITLGESLELACARVGLTWDGARGECAALRQTIASFGLRAPSAAEVAA